MISIIIPVFNKWAYTESCLKDLGNLSNTCEIIVVDNGSTDETINLADGNFHPKLRVIKLPKNTGFAHACNIGFKASVGKSIIFLNNDIRVKSNKVSWVEEFMLEARDGELIGPNGGLLDKDFNFIKETNKVESGNFYMSGWCLGGTRKTFDKLIIKDYIGPFSEEFGIAYFEDTDLGFRASRSGIKFRIVKVPVIHYGKTTSSEIGLSVLYMAAKQIFVKKWKFSKKI